MKRILGVLLGLVVAVVVLPPLWFAVFPYEPAPELPPAGKRVLLPGGIGVNVIEAGEGPAVVLIHGLPGSAYDWRTLVPELAERGRRAIAYGRVGYGRSDPRPDDDFTPEATARELNGLLEALELEDTTLVGWSYGGLTALLAAEQDPTRIGRIVLVGTGGPDSPDAKPPELPFLMTVLNSEPVLRWRVAVPPTGVALMTALSDMAFSGGPQPDWWLDGLRGNFDRWETLLAYRGEMAGIPSDTNGAEFAPGALALPVLILHGDDDRLAPIAIGRYLHSIIPGSTLVEIPDGSHMLPITHAPELADRIAAFSVSTTR
ncbi:MAG: alpha/beta hydrolase [Myxococcales bacterium]|nr:alpha/beta hydrolase [Myxococcales bacterium]